jgi:hypothetical protein
MVSRLDGSSMTHNSHSAHRGGFASLLSGRLVMLFLSTAIENLARCLITARAAGAHPRARSKSRRDKLFVFQPVKRGIDRTSGDLALKPFLDLPQDRASIGVVAESHQREQYRLLKGAKNVGHDYIVDITEWMSRAR